MIVFCAWCHERMVEKETIEVRTITHGCCPHCEEDLLAQDAKEKDRAEAADQRYDEEVREGGL